VVCSRKKGDIETFYFITNKLRKGKRMMKIKNFLICGLVLSFIIVGCGQKEEQPEYAEQQAEQEASQIKESMAKQAEETAAEGSKIIDQAKSVAESTKDKTASIIKELIAKAKALLDQGKFKEAIASAQDVLTNYDSDSQEAKGIIATAKEKLKAMVTEKAKEDLGATTTEKAEGLKGDITDKLKGFGQ
jgi:Flp pilus assembly protein TadD